MPLGMEVLGGLRHKRARLFHVLPKCDPTCIHSAMQAKGQQEKWSRLAAGGLGSDGVSASPAGLGPSAGRKGIPRRSWGSAALSSAGLSFIEDPPKGNLKTLPSHPLAVQVRK